jgi:hypothetical protein
MTIKIEDSLGEVSQKKKEKAQLTD